MHVLLTLINDFIVGTDRIIDFFHETFEYNLKNL